MARKRPKKVTKLLNSASSFQFQASPTSFVQFAIWQNGGLNSEELDTRFRICVQQSLCDLYTELGILSMKIFDVETPNEASARSAVSTVSNALQPQLSIDLTSTKSDPMCLDATGRKMSNISLDRSGGDQQQIQMSKCCFQRYTLTSEFSNRFGSKPLCRQGCI